MSDLPQDQPDLSQQSLRSRIDIVRDAFEQQWLSGNQPRLEEYLGGTTEPEHSTLLRELLEVELEYRQKRGEQPTVSNYADRFPEQAELISKVVAAASAGYQRPNDSLAEKSTVTGKPPIGDTDLYEQATIPPDGVGSSDSDDTSGTLTAPGKRFGDYELLEEIARGGMGVVYKARQVKLKRTVAVKMILAGQLASQEDVARFYSEAEAAAKLDHPGIVPIFEVSEHDGQHYFSMGYVDGISLTERVAGGPLPPREAAEIVRRVAEAVHYAHEHGVIHRDLKPGNILLTTDGQPKVTDFGLAKSVEGDSGLTASGQILGTPSYMPPEQAVGNLSEIGPRSDVYSLGAVLYCLLCGRPPFQSASAIETLKQVLEREPAPLRLLNPSVDRDLETICLKCLEKTSTERFATAQDFADELARFLAGEPIRSRRIGPATRAWRWLKRKPLVAALCASVLVLVVAIAVAVQLAERATLTGRLAELQTRFETRLDQPHPTVAYLKEMEDIVREIRKLAPEQATEADDRLVKGLVRRVEQALSVPLGHGAVESIDALLMELEGRHVPDAARLRADLQRRLSEWQPVFRLAAPFGRLPGVFPGGLVRSEKRRLLPVGPFSSAGNANDRTRTVLTGIECPLHAQLEGTFDDSWQDATEIGLVLNAEQSGAYEFVLQTGRPAASETDGENEPAPVSFRQLRRAQGDALVQIRRNGVALLEEKAAVSRLPDGSLQIRGECRGGRLTLQVGVLPPRVFHDPFPLGARRTGFYGVRWPSEVGLLELVACKLTRPPVGSPLEQGDEHYDAGRFAQALEFYRQRIPLTEDSEFKQEAQYKQALCLLQLNRTDEAVPLLEEILAESGDRWPPLAGCQLWVLKLRQKKSIDAGNVFESLSSRYRLGQLAALLPHDIREEILERYFTTLGSVSVMTRIDPQLVAMVERGAAIDRFLSLDGRGSLKRQLAVSRAYRFVGRLEEGLQQAARVAEDYDEPVTVRDYSRLLRLTGQPQRARELLKKALAEHTEETDRLYPHSLTREDARVLIALDRWREAEDVIDTFIADRRAADRQITKTEWELFLLKGFLREHFDDQPGATKYWREGYRLFKPVIDGVRTEPDIVFGMLLGSLSGEMTGSEVSVLLSRLLSLGTRSTLVGLARSMLPEDRMATAVESMWDSPRGRRHARAVAFQTLTLRDRVRIPVLLALVSFVRQDAFGGELSEAQEQLVWSAAEDSFEGLTQTGKLQAPQIVQLGLTWKGTTNFLGWAGVVPALESTSELRDLRGRLAYILAHRFLQRKDRPQAEEFLRTALKDAPADSDLARLAQTDLDLLAADKGRLIVLGNVDKPGRIALRKPDGTEVASVDVSSRAQCDVPAGTYQLATLPRRDDWRLSEAKVTLKPARRKTVQVDWLWRPGPGESALPGLVSQPALLPGVGRWQVFDAAPRGGRTICYSPDDRWIAVGWDWVGLIRLFDAASRRPVRILRGHTYAVTCLAFDPQSSRLLSGSHDSTIRVWNVATGRSLNTLREHRNPVSDVEWNPDGQRFASSRRKDGTIRIWQADGTLLHTLAGHEGGTTSIAWNPDGSRLASAGEQDRSVRLWDPETGRNTRTIARQDPGDVRMEWRPDRKGVRLAWSPDGKRLAVAEDGNLVHWWNISDWKVETTLKLPHGGLQLLSWQKDDGSFLCVGWGGEVFVWSERHGLSEPVSHIQLPLGGAAAINSRREYVCCDYECQIAFGDLDGKQGPRYGREGGYFSSIDWHPKESQFAVGGKEWGVRILRPDGQTDHVLCKGASVTRVRWNDDGSRLALLAEDGTVELWRTQGTPEQVWNHPGKTQDLAWNHDSTKLVTVGEDGCPRIWDLDGQLQTTLSPHEHNLYAVACSPDGRCIAAAGSKQNVRIWNLEESTSVAVRVGPWIRTAISWSPNGRWLAAVCGKEIQLLKPDGTVGVVCEQHETDVCSLAWSSDSRYLAAGSTHGVIRVWRADGTVHSTFRRHLGEVIDLAWRPDQAEIFSVGHDGVIRVWDVNANRAVRVIVPLTGQEAATFEAGGQLLQSSRTIEETLVYGVETPDGGIELLDVREFHRRVGLTPP